jgi:hypothetical protein
MLLEIFAALFHFHQHDGFPDVIGERRASTILVGFADSEFGFAAHVERAGLTESLKKTVEKDLRLTFFVTGNMLLTPLNEFR